MFKCVVFDVDGTILDTERAILKSLQKILREEQGKKYPLEELRFSLGIPGKETLKKLQISDIDRIHLKWSKAVLDFSGEVSIFAGLEEVIHYLHQSKIKTGIVTSKTKQELMDEFDPFGLRPFFDHTICANDTEKHKPHPEPLLTCLKILGCEPEASLYIGDSIYDMQCAQQAGAKFALALWGAKAIKGFESAHYILEEPQDLLNVLKT
ncbi:HAD family hydrolase [Bacillus sp. PK3_68]|uniref:HAD family hydrolase n=1 Tax=Bacillaceae TaxID=186817 RepID=UPI000E70FF4B|nr:HAD family hydrolase [Bacillus sp. PK3_68]RJS61414.1 HAD family hydrolase [Bacillus sp. PK3_68]